MAVETITTDDEHRAALREIERLWDARPGTADHARLEALAAMVDAYEGQRWGAQKGRTEA